jgi:hypothetical protein
MCRRLRILASLKRRLIGLQSRFIEKFSWKIEIKDVKL